mmetsp:Transcript_13445/g.27218  ORF Transcript_13445/g.27218 Transcript_13445/m.27218 type:complete len:268 (-) Transcript_13445:150-953(-)
MPRPTMDTSKQSNQRPRRATTQTRISSANKPAADDDKASEHSQQSGSEDSENEFPSLVGKTYEMVDDPRTDNVVCWAEDGNGFIVKNADVFCSKVLPTYFRTKRFRSFVRNLNMYGFRSRKQSQEGVYRFRHPQFRRNKKSLLSKIRKKTTQKSILSELRGTIKELRQNYVKLASGHSKMEAVLSQITKALPHLRNLKKNETSSSHDSKALATPQTLDDSGDKTKGVKEENTEMATSSEVKMDPDTLFSNDVGPIDGTSWANVAWSI